MPYLVMGVTLLLLLSSLPTQAQDCTRPIGGNNMNLKDKYILLDTFPDGTKVSFACDVGYMPAGGSASITCTAGSWSPVRLKCERRNCGAVEEVPNGYVDYPRGTEFGDELVVTCNVGFRLVGKTNTRLCGAQGWMGRMPECEVVTCDPPPPVQNGTFRPDQEVYQYGEVVEYSCQQDYTLSGSRTISCSADGGFEPSPPTCIKVQCEEPVIANAKWIWGSRPPHGYQSTVTYVCRSGYTMIGESTLTCGIDSQWSPGLPTCQPQDCTRPIGGNNMNLKDEYILLDTFPDGTKVSFACAVGHVSAGGSASITCTAGSWSTLMLKCERRNCGAAEEVPNGYVDYSQGTEFGDELVVTCNIGFRLVGKNTRLCGAQGWMGRMPECEVVTCDPPPPVQNGTFRPDKEVYQHGEVVEYSCQQDYTLSGSRTISCSADGGFEPSPPTCIKVHCEEPVIANAKWIWGFRPPYGHQSTVTYMCKPGYTMIGESTLTCGIDSQWSPGLPTCQLVTCDPPPTIVNGTFHPKKESYDYSDIVEYCCQKDYTLSGSKSIYCSAHGRFEPAPPTCIMVQCEEPVIRNAEWIWGSRPPYGHQSTVTYMCKPGYTMIGESTLTCGRDGQWSPGLPTCQLIQCEEPVITNAEWIWGSQPPHGYQSMVTYMCKPGYTMIGESTLTCGRDGQWSPGLPTCQPQDCTRPIGGNNMNLKDEYILLDTFPDGTKVSFACAVGHVSAGGSASITCTAGSWSTLMLKCERRNCGAAEEVPNGNVDYPRGTEFGDELVVTCNVGFRLVGKNTRLCGAQGWMGRMPECEVVTCNPPPPVQNGTFRPDKEVYQYGEVVEYSCQQDYTLSGSRTISCSADGGFEPSPPTCIKVHCEEPVIANADWIGGSRPPHRYQSTVTYQCRSGYIMIGESTLICGIDSQWSPGLPTCHRPTTPKTTTTTTTPSVRGCEEPHITNAERIGGTRPPYGYQSLVTYQCKPGYKMIGEPTLRCGRDGQWSPELPKCQADSDTTGNNGNSLALGLGIGLTPLGAAFLTMWFQKMERM
ncbi:sushi, von Willebrand factor type A, EGF and pentraxin domain-containing protein 1-like isoform X3 [Epinephelus lanceolatus]